MHSDGVDMRNAEHGKRYLIDVSKPWHVAWWAKELGVSEDSLLEAVRAVGNQARAVQYHLRVGKPNERRIAPRNTDRGCALEM